MTLKGPNRAAYLGLYNQLCRFEGHGEYDAQLLESIFKMLIMTPSAKSLVGLFVLWHDVKK
jgi:hypothetical protein